MQSAVHLTEFRVTRTNCWANLERSESGLALTNDRASKLFYDNSILMSAPPLTWKEHYTRPGSSIVHNYCRIFFLSSVWDCVQSLHGHAISLLHSFTMKLGKYLHNIPIWVIENQQQNGMNHFDSCNRQVCRFIFCGIFLLLKLFNWVKILINACVIR